MITGKITTYPEQQTTTHHSNYWNDTKYSYYHTMPPWHAQSGVLAKLIAEAEKEGFKLGAKVRRKLPTSTQTIGTIVKVHDTFSVAWNYQTGTLEPFKVQWENPNTQLSIFDYHPEELTLIPDEEPTTDLIFHENIPDLHQSC